MVYKSINNNEMSFDNYERKIDTKQGNYIVAESREFETTLVKSPLQLLHLKVDPGEKTDLYGFFSKPIEFVGWYSKSAACFYLGDGSSDLFSSGSSYYDVTFIIGKNRIFKKYSQSDLSGRDFILVQNGIGLVWK